MGLDLSPKYYVYVWIRNDTDEVFYVGKGTGNRYKTRKRENVYFMRIIEKHECYSKIIKDNLTEKEAFEFEIEQISYYKKHSSCLTNVLDGGQNPPKHTGMKMKQETRAKMSKSMTEFYKNHPEKRVELSNRFKDFLKTDKGKEFLIKSKLAKQSNEYRDMMVEKCKKANNTQEYLEKQSKIVKNMWCDERYAELHKGKNNCRAQKVNQFDIDMNLIATYDTLTYASANTGVSVSKISAVCREKRKTAGGYIWRFATDKRLTMSNVKKGVSNDKCSIPILQYDKDGNLIKEYKSIAEATRLNDFCNRSNIICNLKGRTKSAYGYVWKYKQGNTEPSLNTRKV